MLLWTGTMQLQQPGRNVAPNFEELKLNHCKKDLSFFQNEFFSERFPGKFFSKNSMLEVY